jgi:ABC-type glycerol-3-phosphate transport system substrate-binding protein
MEEKMKKILMPVLVLLLAASIFAGGKGESGASSGSGPVKLRILYQGTSEVERQLAQDYTARVKELYPNYEIEWIYLVWNDMEPKLVSMIQAQDYPDIIAVQEVTNYVAMEALEPLDGYLDTGTNPLRKASFIPGGLDYFTINSKLYAIPSLLINYGLVVNEPLLNSVGMKLEDLKTWDDIKKAAGLMTKGDVYGYAIAMGNPRFAFRDGLIASGSDGFSPNQVEKEKQYKEMLQFYKDLAPYMPRAQVTWAYPEMFTAFCNNKIGMIANGSYFSANVYSINPEIMKVSRALPYPRGPSASSIKGGSLLSSFGYSIIKGSKNKEAAWNVIKVINENELSAKGAAAVNLTAKADVTTDLVGKYAKDVYPAAIDGHLRIIADFSRAAGDAGSPMPKILGQAQMEPVFQKQLLDLIAGSVTVDKAYANIAEEIKKIQF